MSNDVIKAEVIEENFFDELSNFEEEKYETQDTFKSLNLLTKEDDAIVEELLFKGKIPDKDFIKRVKLSGLGVSLQLIQLAKKLSAKLNVLEDYLSKLEDKLFDDRMIDKLETGEMLQLYQSTRILFERTEDMLMKIQEKIDMDSIEMTLKALHTKSEVEKNEEIEDYDEENLDEILQMIAQTKRKKAQEKNTSEF